LNILCYIITIYHSFVTAGDDEKIKKLVSAVVQVIDKMNPVHGRFGATDDFVEMIINK